MIAATALLYTQDAPRSKASDYPAHIALTGMEIGAEYLVHSIPSERGDYFAKEYLVVEVAIFPATQDGLKIDSLKISSGHFTLRINKKSNLTAQSAGTVKRMDAELIGRASVILGAGRQRTADSIDFAVGFSKIKKIGEEVEVNEPLFMIHARNERSIVNITPLIEKAVEIA